MLRVRLDTVLLLAITAIAATDGAATHKPAAMPTAFEVAPVTIEPAPVDDPPLPPPRALEVHALAGGRAVAGAEIAIADGGDAPPIVARTDREGVAHFELAPGPHELWASADHLASTAIRFDEVAATVDLTLSAAARVHVRATADPTGPAPSGGRVELEPLDGGRAQRGAALDDHGELALAGVASGRYRVEVEAPGFVQRAPQVVEIGAADQELEVPLVRAGSVEGSVVDQRGEPVANATIVIAGQPTAVAPRPLDLAATGMHWVHPLAGQRWLPVIDDARFAASRPGPRPAECGHGHCGIDLGTERGSTVHAGADGEIASLFPVSNTEAGKVVVIHHGRGLKSYYMHLDEIRPGLEVGMPIRAGEPLGTLGSTGFSRPLPHVHFAITYEAGGATWYLDPEPIIRRAVILAKPRPYEPVDPAAPRPRVKLPAAPTLRRIVTDAKGAFRIDGVAPGTYGVGAYALDYAPGASASFAVRSGETTDGVTVTVNTGVLVAGRVVGRDGPVAGATLLASVGLGETAHKVATATTDRRGEFTLRALSGTVNISVTAAQYGDAYRAITFDGGDVRRGQRREDFTLTIEDAQLRGQVFTADGGAPANAAVRVVDGPTRRAGKTDATGTFALEHVAEGRYVVEVTADDAPAKRVTLDAGRWTEIRLDPGGGLRCAVRDAATGAPLASARVELHDAAGHSAARAADAHGLVELRGLAAGSWRLTARAAGYAVATRAIDIQASRVLAEATLDLARGASIEGVVRDRQGRRVAGARVTLGEASTVADRDGNYRLADAPAGPGTIEVTLDGRRGARDVRLEPGDTRVALDVELGD